MSYTQGSTIPFIYNSQTACIGYANAQGYRTITPIAVTLGDTVALSQFAGLTCRRYQVYAEVEYTTGWFMKKIFVNRVGEITNNIVYIP